MWGVLPVFFVTFGLSLLLSGCADLEYYRQAAAGQWELLQVRRPVPTILTDSGITPSLRRRLAITQALRDFASNELALPNNGSYRDYADLQRPYAIKNVFAAPELSLEPRQWCYLTVGCLAYRGYFDARAAYRLADDLRAVGDDVYVADIPAYSTLGWFDDPLLNTFVNWPVGRLAELMFHELAHQRFYLAGDTAFNEAFATAVGRLGAQRWLQQWATPREREVYEADYQRHEDFLRLTAATRGELAQLYATAWPVVVKRAEKQRILRELRERYQQLKQQRWGGYSGYDRWFDQDLNNAKLAGSNTYFRWVPAFLELYRHQGEDFAIFYQAVERVGNLPPVERAVYLESLLPSTEVTVKKRHDRSVASKSAGEQ